MIMKKKFGAFITLAALSAASIHIINMVIHHLATKFHLLDRDNEDEFEWRFGKIHYRKYGKGKPLLLLHDLSPVSSSLEWDYVIPILAKTHTVYALDLLGCGKSDKPNLTYTNFLYVQMISDFIKHVIHEPTDIIASGSAAPLVVMADTANQEMVDKMVYINPQCLHDLAKIPSKRSKLLYHFISMPLLGTFLYNILFCRKRISAHAKKFFYDPTQIDEVMLDACHEAAHADRMHSRYLFASIRGNYTKVNITPFLSKITNSVFIITGGNEHKYKDIADEYQKFLPSIEIITIDETKNLPHIEKPEEFCEQIDILLDPK